MWMRTALTRLSPSNAALAVLMQALRATLQCPVRSANDAGWDGDALEAQAFAFLAVRSLRGLPLSFPGTTGVPRPVQGGRRNPVPAAV